MQGFNSQRINSVIMFYSGVCVFVCVCVFFETPLTYVLQVSRQAYHALHGLFGTDFEFRRASQVFADRFDTP